MDLVSALSTSLADRYTIDRAIGRGERATVYLARDLKHNRDVALKVLNPELVATLSAERFTRAMELTAALQNPNIVRVLAAGQTGEGLPWYAMPFVEGETLRARTARGELRPPEALGILRDVARALAYAHEHGLVQRDIKPENILLSSGGALLTGVGLANALSVSKADTPQGALSLADSTNNSPAYLAPEQTAGAAADHRADIYSWGVVAYELLAGEHPFAHHATPQAMVTAHLGEAPEPLGARAWGVPDAISDLVMKCLEKTPEARPQTMLAVISGMAEGQRVSTPTTTAEMRAAEAAVAIAAREKLPKPKKRPRDPRPIPSLSAVEHSRAPLFITVGIIAVIAVLAVVLWTRSRSRDTTVSAPVTAGPVP